MPLFSIFTLFTSAGSIVLVPGLFILFASAGSALPMPNLSALSDSIGSTGFTRLISSLSA